MRHRSTPTSSPPSRRYCRSAASGAAARTAFDDGPCPGFNVHARARVVRRIAELVEENLDELAYLESLDMGKPIAMARAIDAPMTAQLFHYYAGLATQLGRMHNGLIRCNLLLIDRGPPRTGVGQ